MERAASAEVVVIEGPTVESCQTLLRQIRELGSRAVVLVLAEERDDLAGLECLAAGADDIVFGAALPGDLLMRGLGRLGSKRWPLACRQVSYGPVTVELDTERILVNGLAVELCPLPKRLLTYLLFHQGRVIPQAELLEQVVILQQGRLAYQGPLAELAQDVPPSVSSLPRGGSSRDKGSPASTAPSPRRCRRSAMDHRSAPRGSSASGNRSSARLWRDGGDSARARYASRAHVLRPLATQSTRSQ
jgi:hypothetical protein